MKWWNFSLILLAATRCLAQSPPNDYFTNRIALVGPVVAFGGDTTGATWPDEDELEPCPIYYCNQTVWWSWTAPDSTPVIIERLGESTSELAGLAVYPNTNFNAMYGARVCEIDLLKRGQYAVFQPQTGQEYAIQVGGNAAKPVTYRLTVTNAPQFRLQPQTQTVSSNGAVLFSAFAIGVKPLHYQWLHNGLELPGATNAMLSFDGVTWSNAGEYCVVVTNATGVSTSQIARLIVSTNEARPTLVADGVIGGNRFRFFVTGEHGRRYRTELSADLNSWGGGVILNTNETTAFTVNRDAPAKFVRLSIYRPANEVCVNNLRQIRWAIRLCAEDHHLSDDAAVAPGDGRLDGYLIDGRWPKCPSAGVYSNMINYVVADVSNTPTCWVGPASHVLEEP